MKYAENPVAQNRAEEFGKDLWEEFVIPPFYNKLDLRIAKKPRVIVGGRGCGKTMLLRFLCHETQFSKKRIEIQDQNLEHIGLYWKIDTQFAKILSKRGIGEDIWQNAFEHMAVVILGQELLKSIESIAESNYNEIDSVKLDKLNFCILQSFNKEIPLDFKSLLLYLRKQFNYFQTWASNIKKVEEPIFLTKGFLIEIITILKEQLSNLKNSNFYVYIDEYENLQAEQKKLINTWLKHSEIPLIFNIAMKRNSFTERSTIGNEQIVEMQDFRTYDLESFYNEVINFDVFAAEILFLRLSNLGRSNVPINPSLLRNSDINSINERLSDNYRTIILNTAKDFLPGYSQSELAKIVFNDEILSKRLTELINSALIKKKIPYSATDFIDSSQPEASIILPALLSRSIDHKEVIEEFKLLKNGNSKNKFTGKTNWIHNNFIGCLLMLYEPLGRLCPFYSGFEAFCYMSKGNLRHFIELCNKSLLNELNNQKEAITSINKISQRNQYEAAKQASTSFLKEVKAFGNQGNLLHTFLLRIGTIFKYANLKPQQSEPELNHFSIKGNISNDNERFMDELVKWSVLYEEKITKQKGGVNKLEVESFEYILNPIYAPYFNLSYRKKRRIELSEIELDILINGDIRKFELLLNSKNEKWIGDIEILPNLFSQSQ